MNGISVMLSAALTGLFCAGFAVVVSQITGALGLVAVIGVSFVSGFGGSLFAQFVMGRRGK